MECSLCKRSLSLDTISRGCNHGVAVFPRAMPARHSFLYLQLTSPPRRVWPGLSQSAWKLFSILSQTSWRLGLKASPESCPSADSEGSLMFILMMCEITLQQPTKRTDYGSSTLLSQMASRRCWNLLFIVLFRFSQMPPAPRTSITHIIANTRLWALLEKGDVSRKTSQYAPLPDGKMILYKGKK